MHNGYIWLWRKSVNSRTFQCPHLWKVWSWCLLKANHKESWVSVQTGSGQTEVLIKPGQFIFGRKQAAKELNMKPSSVRNRIKKLENMQNLDIQPDTHFSIITVLNWEEYQKPDKSKGQASGQPQDNQRTTRGQPEDTNNNDKNDNNEKNKRIYGEFKNVKLTKIEYEKLVEKISLPKTQELIENLSQYIASKGKRYKSHYATILQWSKRDRKEQSYGLY